MQPWAATIRLAVAMRRAAAIRRAAATRRTVAVPWVAGLLAVQRAAAIPCAVAIRRSAATPSAAAVWWTASARLVPAPQTGTGPRDGERRANSQIPGSRPRNALRRTTASCRGASHARTRTATDCRLLAATAPLDGARHAQRRAPPLGPAANPPPAMRGANCRPDTAAGPDMAVTPPRAARATASTCVKTPCICFSPCMYC